MRPSEQIQSDLVAAMKDHNEDRTAVLRLLKSALKNEQIKLQHELAVEEEMKVLLRESKQRRDSIEAYEQGGRNDLASEERAELEIINGYLPQPLEESEINGLIDQAIAETKAQGIGQIGQVIGWVMSKSAGRAEGGMVSRLVKAKLS